MADGLNRVMLLGNLGADPELKVTDGDYEDTLLAPVAAPRFGYVRCAACVAAEGALR